MSHKNELSALIVGRTLRFFVEAYLRRIGELSYATLN